jgi:hypothetical protein
MMVSRLWAHMIHFHPALVGHVGKPRIGLRLDL